MEPKIARNLQQQVLKNTIDIESILRAEKVLADFGIKVQGTIATPEDLPDPTTYEGDFGFAYAVGTEAPYDYYVWTRNLEWFFIGSFPNQGPQGEPGPQGDVGPQGEPGLGLLSGQEAPASTLGENGQLYLNTTTGTIYKKIGGNWQIYGNIKGLRGEVGPQGPQGPQGIQGQVGPQGPQGDVGGFINIQGHVNSSAELPDPATITNRTWAYLVGANNDLYIQVPTTPGGTVFFWQNFGQLNVGTYVTVNGDYVNTYEMNNKVDVSIIPSNGYGVYARRNGALDFYSVAVEPNINTLAYRTGGGQLRVGTPSLADAATPKSYVDAAIPKVVRL